MTGKATASSTFVTRKLFIKTYGCQMNAYDSARIADVMAPHGYSVVDDVMGADMVVLNTCHIREKAAEKVYSELGRLRAAKDARRGKIIDVLLEKTQVEVPKIFVESELEKIMAQMREDIGRMGLQFEDYLKHAQKTEDAVREEFREQAKKRAKLQLTLNKIAEIEKIEAEKEAVEGEIKHALEHFPDANPELVKVHIETVLKNEKVLQLLEAGA